MRVLPCHRVVASSGAITAYSGGLAAKDRTFKTVRSNQGTLNDAPKRLWWDADAHDRENQRITLWNDGGGAERRYPVLR